MVKAGTGKNQKWVVGCVAEVEKVCPVSQTCAYENSHTVFFVFVFVFPSQMALKFSFEMCFFTISIAIRYPYILYVTMRFQLEIILPRETIN